MPTCDSYVLTGRIVLHVRWLLLGTVLVHFVTSLAGGRIKSLACWTRFAICLTAECGL